MSTPGESFAFDEATPMPVVHEEPPEDMDGPPPEPQRDPLAKVFVAKPETNGASRTMPASEEAERHVIAACLLDGDVPTGGDTLGRAITEGLKPESFFWPQNSLLFSRMLEIRRTGLPLTLEVLAQELRTNNELEQVGGFPYLMQVTSGVPTTAHAGYMIATVKEKADRRQLIRDFTAGVEQAYNGAELPELLQTAKARVEAIQTGSAVVKQADAIKALESRRVSACNAPVEPVTRLFLAGKPVATPGNLQSLISKVKTGKTATIGGAVAAIIAASTGRTDVDTLGFTSSKPTGAVVVIDTEQSPYDAYMCYKRTLQRADTEKDPEWLCHYALVGYSVAQRKEALVLALETSAKKHGGVFTVVLDGVAHFVLSVNDEGECNALVTWLRSLTVQYNCPIFCVIHSNETIKAGDDGRGHLGKALMRESESNLLLKKSNEVTVITSEKQRKAPITEEDGVAFKWSDAEQRHVSCGTPMGSKEAEKRADLHDLANEVFDGKTVMKWTDILTAIMAARTLSRNSADRRIQEMKRLGVIQSTFSGQYEIVP